MSSKLGKTKARAFGLIALCSIIVSSAKISMAFQSTPQVYCAPGRNPTCFAIRIVTQPEADGGTDVTLTLTNLQGASNFPLQLPPTSPVWTRVHRIEIVAPDDGSFHGGEFTTDVRLALANATAVGDTAMKWGVVPMVVEPGVARGYVVGTDIMKGGAEIVGCGLPPDLDYPYLQTCHASGQQPEVTLHFSTDGSWTAAQVRLALTFEDPTGEFTCEVSETVVGANDPFACERLGATPAPPSNTPPIARTSGPYVGVEGAPVALDASFSTDTDAGDVLTYQWNFGDNTTGSGVSPQHIYKNNGTYNISVTATDKAGLFNSANTSVVVSNAPPSVNAIASGAWRTDNSSALLVSFVDANPKDSPFIVRIDWGDGSPISSFASTVIPATPFNRPHVYTRSGNYVVTVTVTDRDGGVGLRTVPVQVSQ